MTYEQYAVTVNTSRWDFSQTEAAHGVFSVTFAGFSWYVRIFEPLVNTDLPEWYNITSFHANAFRCNQTGQWCRSISTPYDYEWSTDEYNLGAGIWFQANGDPNKISDEYEDWALEIEFACSPGGSTEPDWMVDRTQADPRIVMFFKNDWGCPSPAPLPPAIKSPPTCLPVFRQPNQTDFGIGADLNELNNGRFGYGQLTVHEADIKYVLYRPCGYIAACPWGATACSTTDLTSAWVCNLDYSTGDPVLTTCTAYGAIGDSPNFSLVDRNDLFQGFTYTLDPQAGRGATITLGCHESYPRGHIMIDVVKTRLTPDGNRLNLTGSAREFCPRLIPTPVPNASQCQLSVAQGTYFLSLDLSAQPVSNSSVTRSRPFLTPYDLLYAPCAPVQCPADYDCGGAEDARVFLCEKWDASHRFCTAYGLDALGSYMKVRDGYIPKGVDVSYRAHNDREADAFWECDSTLPPGTYAVQPTVSLDDSALTFVVKSRDVCIIGSGATPTPPGHVFPPKPRPPTTPTPTPLASPRAVYGYWNATHYVALNWIEAQEPWPWHQFQDLYIRGAYGETYTVWNAWDRVGCPNGWPCHANETANLWQCWEDENFEPYCHAVADKHVPGFTFTATNANWDTGGSITYPGQWGARMSLRVACPPYAPSYERTIDLSGSTVAYSDSIAGPTWTFNASSAVACPNRYGNPPTPSASRSPPPPNPTVQTSFDETVNDRHWHLDLADLRGTTQTIIMASQMSSWYKSEFHYSPLARSGCPDGKSCGVYAGDLANVWECIDSDAGNCFPVGDMAYGLTIQLINESLETSGINVTYAGGAAGHAIRFFYHCNDTLLPGDIVLFEVGEDPTRPAQADWHPLLVNAQTLEVCDKAPGPIPGPVAAAIAAGAVFLLVVLVLLVLYVGIGTLVLYARTGTVSVPNEALWREVFESIADGVAFVVSCGDKRPSGPIYDRV
jgi:hypothetical protein